jgi:hypothetical protein
MTVLVALLCPCDRLPVLLPADSVGRRVACPDSGARFVVPPGGRPFGDDEWRACQVPQLVVRYLYLRGRVPSDRKCRLLRCAHCRRSWHQLPDERYRRAVELAERFADGLVGEAERQAAEAAVNQIGRALWDGGAREQAPWAWWVAGTLIERVPFGTSTSTRPHSHSATASEECALLREIVGDPFRPVRIDPAWRAWDGGCVPGLARTIYEGRAFDRLPVLADALEEAGCTDADLLGHLRVPGPHVPGCWALDALLGRDRPKRSTALRSDVPPGVVMCQGRRTHLRGGS